MKLIGIIGGMSWKSSAEYYRVINETVKKKLGGLNSAKILMYSVNFKETEFLQRLGKWEHFTKKMIRIAKRLEKGGANFIIICSNTGNKAADGVQKKIGIPILNIIDVTAKRIKTKGFRKIGLLGTKITMEENFYKDKLTKKYGLEVIIPDKRERQVVSDIIYKELCKGIIKKSSKKKIKKIIRNLIANGAEGIILGCTELPLIIEQKDVRIPAFDTTTIHAEAAVEYALNK